MFLIILLSKSKKTALNCNGPFNSGFILSGTPETNFLNPCLSSPPMIPYKAPVIPISVRYNVPLGSFIIPTPIPNVFLSVSLGFEIENGDEYGS